MTLFTSQNSMKKLDLPILFLTASLLAVGSSSTTSAQTSPQILISASFDELAVPVTPRELGLGNNFLVDSGKGSNIEIARSNPSALNVSGSLDAVAGHTFYAGGPDDIAATYLTVGRPFGQTNVALSFNLWDTSIGPNNEILIPPSDEEDELLQHSRRVVILGSTVT